MKVFLHGQSNGSFWKKEFIEMLKVDFVDPEEKDRLLCDLQRSQESCDFILYVLTPNTINFYSIAELIDNSNKIPEKIMYVHYSTDRTRRFNKEQVMTLYQITKMVKLNGAGVFFTLDNAAEFLNGQVMK